MLKQSANSSYKQSANNTMTNIVTIHQPQYIPWVPYFDKILQSDTFVLLDDVQFQKNGLQNRNQIKTAQGASWLTVPVQQSLTQKINVTKIANQKAVAKHLKSIQSNYAKSPYFDEYYHFLETIIAKKHELLVDLNNDIILGILKKLDYKGTILLASSLEVEGAASELVLNLCTKVQATTYLSGTGGKNYLNLEDFRSNKIEVTFQSYHNVEYPQMFPNQGFIPHLSILDLLFNTGPKCLEFITKGRQH